MPRVLGVDIPAGKRIEVSLTYLFGIGRSASRKVLASAGIDPDRRAKDLSDEEVGRISQTVQANYKVEGDLRREIASNIKRVIDIGSYRGLRHKKGLPVRGQQTRTNARTRKGPRPRVGVRKRPKPVASGAPARPGA